MKKFIKKIILLIIIFLLSFVFYVSYQNKNNKDNNLAAEVFQVIEIAKKTNKYEKVIIGDSVARQIFPPEMQNETDKTCYLTSNQAITVLGNYLLLIEYLDNNPQTEEIIYLARPQTFANDMWLRHSYQYFIIPFYSKKNKQYIDDQTKETINDKFGEIFVNNNKIKDILWENPFIMSCYLNRIQKQTENMDEKIMSNLSINYLIKISELCKEKEIKLRVLSSPLSDFEENRNWSNIELQIKENNLEQIMKGYIESITYYDNDVFGDGTHFKSEYLENNRDKIIKNFFLMSRRN